MAVSGFGAEWLLEGIGLERVMQHIYGMV